MATTFHRIDADLYGQEGFSEQYKDAQWAALSPEQKQRLFMVLDKDTSQSASVESVPQSSASPEQIAGPGEVFADGAIFDVWDRIDPTYKEEIEQGISHVLQSGDRSCDLLLGMWADVNTTGWKSTIGPHGDISEYNIVPKKGIDMSPSSHDRHMLLLRVIPQGTTPAGGHKVAVKTVILEQPGTNTLIMPGMVFVKELKSPEILDVFGKHKNDLHMGATA